MSNSTVVNGFVSSVRTFLEEYGLVDQSHRIFNIDESWFSPSEEKRQKVIVGKGRKNAYKVSDGISEHITMVIGASFAGQWLPPFFIFKGSLPTTGNGFLTTGPQNALYGDT